MILKKLELENIRSFKKILINFESGVTLITGDIGSGKSSILMAIEFAFFGLGSSTGDMLLRKNAKQGQVQLTFEIKKKQYTVIRYLVRTKSVKSEDCKLITDSGEELLAVQDLKPKMLNILGLNENTHTRARHLIYEYTIYTPQNEIYAFIDDDKERSQTLMKAFGIEDYRVARKNATDVAKEFRNKSKHFKDSIADSQSSENDLKKFKNKLPDYEKNLEKITDSINSHKNKLEALNIKLKNLQNQNNKIKTLDGEINNLQQLQRDTKNLDHFKSKMDTAKKEIDKIKTKLNDLGTIGDPTERTVEKIEEEISMIDVDVMKLNKAINKDENKRDAFQDAHNKGECPVCEQITTSSEFIKKIDKTKTSLSVHKNELAKLENNKKNLEEIKVKKTEYVNWEYDRANYNEKLKSEYNNCNTFDNLYSSENQKLQNIKKKLDLKNKEKNQLSSDVGNLNGLNDEKKTSNEIKTYNVSLQSDSETKGKFDSDMKNCKKDITRLEGVVNKINKYKRNCKILDEYGSWLKNTFNKNLEEIEKQVASGINTRLNYEFMNLFKQFIDNDEQTAGIDAQFNPIIKHNGEEQPIKNLSGGEKTSAGLAYRFAFNTVYQEFSYGRKLDMLILDEPTYGFDTNQTKKFIEIMENINSEQIIIVSHNPDLADIADNMFKLEKIQDTSLDPEAYVSRITE